MTKLLDPAKPKVTVRVVKRKNSNQTITSETASSSLAEVKGRSGRSGSGGRRKMDQLSSKQQKILEYIRVFQEENNMPPTVREIKEELKISSTSVVDYNLAALEFKGHIVRRGGKSRGIELVGWQRNNTTSYSDNIELIPMWGTIAAGSPISVPEEVSQDMIEVPAVMFKSRPGADVFALRVKGYSMVDALINDGDIVLIKKQETAEVGETVAAWLEDERTTTLKKWYPEANNRIRLQPANPTMDPIYTDRENFRIMGKLVGVIRTCA